MARPKRDIAINPQASGGAFFREMELALDHFTEPEWLGEHSSLAAPYFLAGALVGQPDSDTSLGRGKALQKLLLFAASELKESLDKRYNPLKLLQLAYFRPNPQQNLTGVALELGLSPATFFRHRQEAIAGLEHAFARHIRPAVRMETPRSEFIVGRAQALETCLEALRNNRVVSITGPGGIGKTAFSAYTAGQFAPESAFWHTLRLRHNDDLNSFVYGLASFLQRCGQPLLWLQLAAEKGRVDSDLALNLIKESLIAIRAANPSKPLLICVDEMDVLRRDPAESQEHARLRSFLEGLIQPSRLPCGVLLIGQQPVIEPDIHLPLEPLTVSELKSVLFAAGVMLDEASAERLQELTRGNPLLLRLFINLHLDGELIPDLLKKLPITPSLQLLLERVQRHLNLLERGLLNALSVYESACPRDAWRADEQTVESLIERGLVMTDSSGGLLLQPVIHQLVQRQLSAEEREKLHLAAAGVFASRAQYTVAAHHFVEANRPDIAISMWYVNREQEIFQGQANTALEVFRRISKDQLSDDNAKTLVLLRSELISLTGDADEGLAELGSQIWRETDSHTPRAAELTGIFLLMQAQVDSAIDQLSNGFRVSEIQLEQIRIQTLATQGYALLRNRDMAGARQVVVLARHIADILEGLYLAENGQFQNALTFYLKGLESAIQLADKQRIAVTNVRIGSLAIRLGDYEMADNYYSEALKIYSQIGDNVTAARTRSNLAVMYLHAGQYKRCIEVAEQALTFFEKLRQPYWIALNTSNIAEANLELNDLERAELFANRSLREEESNARPYALTTLGRVFLARGNNRESERYLREAIATAQEAQDKWAEAPAWRALAIALRKTGDQPAATEAFQTAISLYEEMKLSKEVERTRSTQNAEF